MKKALLILVVRTASPPAAPLPRTSVLATVSLISRPRNGSTTASRSGAGDLYRFFHSSNPACVTSLDKLKKLTAN